MIFLDSADEAECALWTERAVVRGVTVNATLLKKAGAVSVVKAARAILDVGVPELHLPVLASDDDQAFGEAVALAELDDKVRVKVAMVGADGRLRTALIDRCARDGIPVNVTVCTTLAQAFVALGLNPRYLSLLWCRTRSAGDDPAHAVSMLGARRRVLDCATGVLVGSIREPADVSSALAAGADVVTVPPHVLTNWLNTETSRAMAAQFDHDAQDLRL